MTDEEMLIALGRLAREARDAKGHDRARVAKEMGVSYNTLAAFERAENGRIPAKASRRSIEVYYGWRPGVIEELWDRRRTTQEDSLDLRDFLAEENKGVLEARHLTDDQLINELAFRLIMKQHG